MIKAILFTALFTVSAFAATHAQAAMGQVDQAGFVSGGGSYEFTKCTVIRSASYCKNYCNTTTTTDTAFRNCYLSYNANKQTSNTPKQGMQRGFTQGKFRSH